MATYFRNQWQFFPESAINEDIEAGYSTNGFQLYEISKQKKLKLLWEYDPQSWGPVDIKWVDENNLLVKCYTMKEENGILIDKHFYLKLQIKP